MPDTKIILAPPNCTGHTLYAVIADRAAGTVWNGAALEAYADGNWATYDVALAEQGTSGRFVLTMPSLAAGRYDIDVRRQVGTTPALADIQVATVDGVDWDGTGIVPVSSRMATFVYTAPLDASGTRTALGMSTNNLDAQLAAILASVSEAGPGEGIYPIDHDGGTGLAGDDIELYIPHTAGSSVGSSADVLRFTASGVGVPNLHINAYLASDYDADPPSREIIGQAFTGSDGRWLAPINLNSGTYYLIVDAANDDYQATQIKVVVP